MLPQRGHCLRLIQFLTDFRKRETVVASCLMPLPAGTTPRRPATACRRCADSGLLRGIKPAGHPVRFKRRVGDNHHHLVCRGYGRTDDVDGVVGERPCLEPVDEHGFVIDEARRNGSDRSTAQDDNRCRCAG